MLVEKKKDSETLADGRVIKRGGRVEAIVTDFEERVLFRPFHWKSNRMLRRDFNSMMVGITYRVRSFKGRVTFERMLVDLELEAYHLADSTYHIEVPVAGEFSELPLRLVSPEAKRLLEALAAYDKAMAKLSMSEDREAVDEHCRDFLNIYSRIKRWLFENEK